MVGQAVNAPKLVPVGGVANHAVRARQDNFEAARALVVDGRCGKAVHKIRTLALPQDLAVGRVDGHEVGPQILVTDHDELAIGQDGRSPHAVIVGKRSERQSPQLIPIRAVGEQSVTAEKDIDVRSIRDGCRRSLMVEAVHLLLATRRGRAPPHLPASCPVKGESQQLAVCRCCQKQPIDRQDRRGLTGRDSDLPSGIGSRPEDDRQAARLGNATAIGTAKPCPFRGQHHIRAEEYGQQQLGNLHRLKGKRFSLT